MEICMMMKNKKHTSVITASERKKIERKLSKSYGSVCGA
jgi:hypothetical protein